MTRATTMLVWLAILTLVGGHNPQSHRLPLGLARSAIANSP